MIGAENLTKPDIAEAIRIAVNALATTSRISAADAWQELSYIALSDIGDILDMTGTEPKLKPACDIPKSARRAIKSVKIRRFLDGPGDGAREVEVIEFTFWDKPGQIITALKAMGEVKDHVHVSGRLETNYVETTQEERDGMLMAMASRLAALGGHVDEPAPVAELTAAADSNPH